MVRHGVKLHTTRTPEQVAQALDYMAATAHQIDTAADSDSYPCALSAACGTCQFRLSCPTYGDLLKAAENENKIASATGARLATVAEAVATISNNWLNAFLKAQGMPKLALDMLSQALQATAKPSYMSQIRATNAI